MKNTCFFLSVAAIVISCSLLPCQESGEASSESMTVPKTYLYFQAISSKINTAFASVRIYDSLMNAPSVSGSQKQLAMLISQNIDDALIGCSFLKIHSSAQLISGDRYFLDYVVQWYARHVSTNDMLNDEDLASSIERAKIFIGWNKGGLNKGDMPP